MTVFDGSPISTSSVLDRFLPLGQSYGASLLIFTMPGVQSFVAQRQQGYQTPSRQILGAHYRVPVPTTKLENAKEKPSFHRPSLNTADPPMAGQNTNLSRQQSAKVSDVQGSFDTDAEGFDDSVTMSIGGSSQRLQNEGYGRAHMPSRYGVGASNDSTSGPQASIQRRQEQTHHVQGLDAEGLGAEDSGEGSEGSGGESSEVEEDEESDGEKSVGDGILQDLNSPGFSQFLQGETSYTTEDAFQPVMAFSMAHNSLALRDVVQHSQRSANPSPSKRNSVNSGAADPGVKLKRANSQAHERFTKETSGVPAEKVADTSMEQLSIAAQHPALSDHHESSQLPSVASHQTLWPTGVTRKALATYTLPQAKEERPLSVQKESIHRGDGESRTDWDPNVDPRSDRKPSASIDDPQTRKRTRDLDYSLNQLSNMTYQQLSSESFNLASNTAWTSVPQKIPHGSLVEKLDHIMDNLKDDDAKLVQRKAFFSSLSIDQYEECAKLIICRFSAIMSKFTDARQQRRQAAKGFEEEIAKREACVNGKTMVVDKDLDRLKRGGEEVVRGASL